MMNILIFSGSAREGNFTQHVASFVKEMTAAQPDISVELVSPESLGLKIDDEGEGAKGDYPGLTEKVLSADAYIIVSPEYNHGYPGSLKYMLDLHLKEYIHKPVAIVGVSKGPFGGTRMIEVLSNVVRELGMIVTFTDVNVTNVQDIIVEGSFKDPEPWQRRTQKMIDELIWMATVLKWGRENVQSQYHT